MAKITLTDIASGYNSYSTYNANNTLIEAAIENTLSRDGTSPNTMNASLDMNSNRIVNLPNASNNTEPVTLGQAASIQSFTGVVATAGAVGEVLWAQTSEESTAGVTPINYSFAPGDLRRYGNNTTPGTTDVTTAVTNWINVGLQGTPLVHPGGVWLCSTWTQIAVTTDLRIRGYADAQLKATATKAFLQPAGGDIDIEGIEFNTWQNVLENVTGDTGTTDKLRIHNCKFDTISGGTIQHERPLNSCWITANKFNATSNYVIRIGENTYANQDTWKKIIISDNECIDVNGSGSNSTAFCLVYGKEAIIERNIIDDVLGATGEGWGIYTKTRFATISHNIISNIDSTSNADIQGINVKGNTRGVTTAPQGYSVKVIGNNIRTCGTAGTDGGCIRAQTDDVLIMGNICEDGGITGIGIDEAAGSENMAVIGNKIRFASSTSTVGVRVSTGSDGHIISHNQITNANVGIRLDSNGVAGTDYMISENQIDSVTAGISVNSPQALSEVRIRGNLVSGGTYGFLNSEGAGSLTQWEFVDNDFEATTTPYSGEIPKDSKFVQRMHGQTTNGTVTSLFQFELPDNTAFRCDWDVMGMESDGSDRAVYSIGGLFYRNGAGATQQGSDWANFTAIESDATWTGADLNPTGNVVQFRVQGVASQTINWSCELTARSID